jgi:hypothetical protein
MKAELPRESFLLSLESALPGISAKETVEQSTCFVFRDGWILSFNDEVACRAKSGLPKEFVGATKAEQLVTSLREFKGDFLKFSLSKDVLSITCTETEGLDVAWDNQILLPINNVERSKDWKDLDPDFVEAISLVRRCADKGGTEFIPSCVHITADFVESMGNFQAARWEVKTPLRAPFLVRRNAVQCITSLGVVEFSETDNWIHFRNSSKTVLSCRRYANASDFPDLSKVLTVEGNLVSLPGGIVDVLKKCSIFTSQLGDDPRIRMTLCPKRIKVVGTGVTGSYWKVYEIEYEGRTLDFFAVPEVLMQVFQRHRECVISEDRLLVDMGNYKFVTILLPVDEK